LVAPFDGDRYFAQLASQAVLVNGPEIRKIRATARDNDIFVSIGFTEASAISVGCLWNANVLIGSNGDILNHHRKLVPTFFEKLVWANGDGAGLRVNDTELGGLGMLICGENTNPLARYSLMAQGEQVHISTYPSVGVAGKVKAAGTYDLEQAIRIRAAAHAFEAKAFNIVASAYYDASAREAIEAMGSEAAEIVENSPRAVSMILGPSGTVISNLMSDQEGLVTTNIDLKDAVVQKQIHDVVGYYNRFDIFKLSVDRSANRPIYFPFEASQPHDGETLLS
jgi:aliphatic nitrilase